MSDESTKESVKLRRQVETLQAELANKESEIEDLLKRHREMERLAHYDALTGLLNRSRWFQLVENIAPNELRPDVCLLIIDVDLFKEVNDRFGHAEGDTILRELAKLIKEICNENDLLGRLGGEEFIIAIQRPIDIAYDFAELIRSRIETEDKWMNRESARITVSIGVAPWKLGQSLHEVISVADMCLYAAKGQGRNKVITTTELSEGAELGGEDLIVADLENRIRVATDLLARYLMIRARRVAHHYKEKSIRDGLTGVYNRGYLDNLLGREVEKARKYNRPLTILMIDLDDFGQINKRYGWTGGDLAIKRVVSIIQQHVRANDWVARFGGDEFIVTMPDTPHANGQMVAERIRLSVAESPLSAANGEIFRVTASIGVLQVDPAEGDLQEIYTQVGTATRDAKDAGKNQVGGLMNY